MIKIGIITVSDRSFRKLREDLSGPAIRYWAENRQYSVTMESIVPDEVDAIKAELIKFSDAGVELIFTTGGTGFAERDVTPEATIQVLDKPAPGFAEHMRSRSMNITSHAMLSRAVSGIRKKSLIINLPGSPKAVRENLEFIEDAIPHAIGLLRGTDKDCGSE